MMELKDYIPIYVKDITEEEFGILIDFLRDKFGFRAKVIQNIEQEFNEVMIDEFI